MISVRAVAPAVAACLCCVALVWALSGDLAGAARTAAMPTATPAMSMSTPTAAMGMPTATPGMGMTGPIPGAIVKPLNVAFARSLPYTVLVTDMGMNDMNAMVPQTMSMDTNKTTSGLRVLGSGKFLHTGIMAHGVAVLPGTSYAFVSDFMGATVKEVNIKTMQVVRTFAVGVSPTHTVFLPNHRYAFVSDFGSNDLSRLDIQTGQVRSISFPKHDCFKPHGLTLSADGGTLYVACAGDAWI